LRDPRLVRVSGRELPARLQLDEREFVRPVAVDLVRRGEDEDRVRTVPAKSLQQVERAGRVDVEVRERLARGPIVRGLSGRVDDQLDRGAEPPEERVD